MNDIQLVYVIMTLNVFLNTIIYLREMWTALKAIYTNDI